MTKYLASTLLALWILGTLPAMALEITSVAPARGTPGTAVILTGGLFTEQSRIFLGERYVAPEQRLPRQMRFLVPDLPPGSYSLTVQDDVASAVQPFNFEVLVPRPQIAGVEPDNLDVCADETERLVRIRGSNFRPETVLLLGGNAVSARTVDATAMEFRLPDLPAGVYGMEAHNPDGAVSLPHSLWINSVPQITGVERGEEFVNHYEVIIRGRNFFHNSILVVREPDALGGGVGARQMTYYAHRGAPDTPAAIPASQGERLRYVDCRTLIYLRYPSNFQDKDILVQVVNPDGKKTDPYPVTLP